MNDSFAAAAPQRAEASPWHVVGQEWQVAYWAHKCGVSRDQLASAIGRVNLHDMPVAEWVDRCAQRLGLRQPYISPVQALARAIDLHDERGHMRPETAAELEFSDWPRRRA